MTPQTFIERTTAAAADVALALAGEAEENVVATLHAMKPSLQAKLSAVFDTELAAELAEVFVRHLLERRAELEAVATRAAH